MPTVSPIAKVAGVSIRGLLVRRGPLAAVLLVALVLRFGGLSWSLPYPLYDDELKYVLAATLSVEGIEGREPDYRNPSLLRHALNLEYRLDRLFGRSFSAAEAATDPEGLAARILLARQTVALFGVGSVLLLYLAGRRAFGEGVGLLAAALLAVNFLHVHLSHFGVSDVPAGFFLVAALVPAVGLLRQPTGRGFLLTGLFAGLATATKYNFGVVLVVPLLGILLHAAQWSRPKPVMVGPLLLLAGAGAGFLLGMPETPWAAGDIRAGILRQAEIGERAWSGQADESVTLLYLQTLAQAGGWPALLAALVGTYLLLQRRPRLTLALAACPLLYLAYMSSKELFFARFALPVIPFVCLFAAYGLVRVWSGVRGHGARRFLVLLGAAILLLPPAALSVRLNLLTGQPDTRVEARRWVTDRIPSGTTLAVQSNAWPIVLEGDEVGERYRIVEFRAFDERQDFTRLVCRGSDYVLLSSFAWDRERITGRGGRQSGYQALRERGRLVATFWPGPNNSRVPFNLDNVGLPFWEIAQHARPGPTIEIYEISEPRPARC